MTHVYGSVVEIRDLRESDSIGDLTALLHRAYKRLLDMGFRYKATTQTEQDTRERISGGVCLVAVLGGRIVSARSLTIATPYGVVGPG